MSAMTMILAVGLGVVSVLAVALFFLYLSKAKALKHFESISDVEQYKADCEEEARKALANKDRLSSEASDISEQLKQYNTKVAQYQKLLGNLKTAADLKNRIQSDTTKAQQLASTLRGLERASQLANYLARQESEVQEKKLQLEDLSAAIGDARTATEIAAKVEYQENYLAQLKADIEAVEEAGQLHEFGFYRPRYDFDKSESYKRRLDTVRQQQKTMLKDKSACVCDTEWVVEGSKREGQKMVNQQIKLMLRAFNGESDAAVSKAKYNNVVALEKRITKSFEAINKLGETKRISLVSEYFHLKLDELHLAHEYQEKVQEEKDEEKRVRDLMREEQKVAKEIEKAQADAEKEEKLKTIALEKARQELASKTGQQTEKLEALVSKLENELQEALDRKAKAIARAQLTRSGHVYVLSNIGTLGQGIYKIGLTRRLEPLERVKELGSASVPFPFDVHAMIYSEDAPALENALHKHFSHRRVNMVNLRKEFFRVTLDEIRMAVAKQCGQVTFFLEPDAEEYRKTTALMREKDKEASPLQIA